MTAPFPPRRRPGWRGRIGVIQPAPGVMLEQEWPRFLPAEVLFPVGRIPLTSGTAQGYHLLATEAPECARDLATADCDVIAYACAIGSLFAGVAAEADLIASLENASGKPAISLAKASVEALRRVGASKVAILTPYAPATNVWVTDYLSATGFTPAGTAATPVDIFTVGTIAPAEIVEIAVGAMDQLPDADSLWIPCTAIQTMEALAKIECRIGRPVVSGSQALLWSALRKIGIDDPILGAGRLLA